MPVMRYIVVLVLALPLPALAESETIPGPIVVDVVQVIDGDTIEIHCHAPFMPFGADSSRTPYHRPGA